MPREDGQFKPGAAWRGNAKGRPKGDTLKEFVRKKLLTLEDKDKLEFLKGLPKNIIWEMAEGRPTQKEEVEHSGKVEIDMNTKQKIDKAIDEIL